MPKNPILNDRSMKAKLRDLKLYNNFKAQQLQTGGGEPIRVDEAMQTIETWAGDAEDNGQEWAERRKADADRAMQESAYWQNQVHKDEQQASAEDEFRAKLDMDAVKSDLTKKLDDYEDALRQQADAGQPWAKKKLIESKRETNEARQFIDSDLNKAMELSDRKGGQMRRRRKLIADKVEERAAEARQWKADYADQPEKHPEGQRDDVKESAQRIIDWVAQAREQLQPFGKKAAAPRKALGPVEDWAEALGEQVEAVTPGEPSDALTEAKVNGMTGVMEARTAKGQIEAFYATVEAEANENIELYRRWTDRNNALAKEWITSDNPKRKQWAEAWQETQQ